MRAPDGYRTGSTMRAAVLHSPGNVADRARLVLEERAMPLPGPGQVLVQVEACGVCHTDLHVVEGELPPRAPAVVPGHQIVGVVSSVGDDVDERLVGQRVGAGWLGRTDGTCRFCRSGRENLCEAVQFTGYDFDGGYADHVVLWADFVHPLPTHLPAERAAPLLCAGVIGHRALRHTGIVAGQRLGLYGFGASAHLVLQEALALGCQVLVFTRGDAHRDLALRLGAVWAGPADETHPAGGPLDGAIIFAPAGPLVPLALQALDHGGTLVLAGIHMSPIPSLDYDLLWHERVVRSVANGTREDAREFLRLTASIPLHVETRRYPLSDANKALADLKRGAIDGAAVLLPG